MRHDKFLLATSSLILLLNLFLDDALWQIHKSSDFVLLDLKMQRRLCAYALRGVDPFPFIGAAPPHWSKTLGASPRTLEPRLGD